MVYGILVLLLIGYYFSPSSVENLSATYTALVPSERAMVDELVSTFKSSPITFLTYSDILQRNKNSHLSLAKRAVFDKFRVLGANITADAILIEMV